MTMIDIERLFHMRDGLVLVASALAASAIFNWHVWLKDIIRLREIKLPRVDVGKLALPAIILIAAILRLVRIAHDALWFDEAFTSMLADMPVDKMIAVTAADVHPPGWYIVAKAFTIFGNNEFVLRLPSALLGILAVWMTWLVLREIAGERVALVGAGLLAISPFAIYYSNEARMYSLLLVEILVALLGTLRRWPLLAIIAIAAALLTHNMAMLYVPVIGLLMWKRSGFWRATLACGCAIAIWAVLWLPSLLGQMAQIDSEGYWIKLVEDITVAHWLHEIQSVLFGALALSIPIMPVNAFFTTILLIAPLVEAVRQRDAVALTLAGMAFIPMVCMLIVSLIWQPMILARPLIGCLPAWVGLIAWWVLLPRRWDAVRIGVVASAAIVFLASTCNYYVSDRAPYIRQIVAWMRENWRPGDAIVYATPADYIAIGANIRELEPEICVAGEVGAPFDVIVRPCEQFTHAWLVVAISPMTAWVTARADEMVEQHNGQLRARFGDEYVYASVYELAGGKSGAQAGKR